MKWYEIILIAGTFVSAFYLWYQLYKIIEIDADSRGLKRPKFWAIFATSQDNRLGLLLYLVGRRKFVSDISESDLQLINQRKKKASFSILGLLVFVLITLAFLLFNYS